MLWTRRTEKEDGSCCSPFLYFFIDTLTPEGDKELKDNSLYGVKMRCQNGVIWFCLTLGLSDDDFCEKF